MHKFNSLDYKNFSNFSFFLILQFLFTSFLLAQDYNTTISGYVYDKDTNEPIENVNVYISNTTFGSSTDINGYYIIKSAPPAFHELVLTVVSYKTETKNILVKKNQDLNLNFKLKPVVYEVQPIDITSTVPDDWLKNLAKFKYIFLGKTFRSSECIIKNAEVLDFQRENTFVLTATSEKPLLIENHTLGFKINCILVDFSYNKAKNTWTWEIKPRFEEMQPADSIESERWKINRRIAYFGSIYHFFSSLKNNTIDQLGYKVYYSETGGKENFHDPRSQLALSRDSLVYVGIDSNTHIFSFNGYLLIKNFNLRQEISAPSEVDVDFGETDQISWIILKYGELSIDEYGYPIDKNAFSVLGYWSNLGIADLLPRYYKIE